ncbi:MAG: apolipoprotein N-acyltransferase, partial [Gloeomargaritaceae cyanobacterium C42_A2020_066]|nr:apolipoprotein N-acyltransferase [Gloeomargaritaceae cyanobacterium C42_A2020_066]
LWAVLENLWSQSPLWWTTLALTQSPGNLAILHLGQGAGPAGVSVLIVAVNGGLALAWQHRSRSWLGLTLGLWVMGHAIGLSLYGQPLQDLPGQALRVGLIQGNIPNQEKFTPAGRVRTNQVYGTGYRDLADRGVDLVLTPEGALPYTEVAAEVIAPDLFAAVREREIPLVLGVYGQNGRGRPTNGLALILGDGRVHGRYDKVRLVPLGEYIPGEDGLNELGIPVQRLSLVGEGFAAGRPDQVFRTPWGPAGVALCYESAYPDRFRTQVQAGATLLLTAANNDPYSPRMMAQHQALEVMRAIETDRWLARATNTGYSSLIDPHGHVRWQSQANQVETQTVTLYRRSTGTLWVRWGDWLTPGLVGLAVLSLAAGRWRPG